MTENYFTLWQENMNTVDVLNGKDLVLDSDRRFEISVDSEPANGRPNHVRSAPEAHEFYIRDVMLDWAEDEPNELHVERPHMQGAHGRFASDGERFGQQVLQGFTIAIAFLELISLCSQRGVIERLQAFLKRIDFLDGFFVLTQQALITTAEDTCQEIGH